MDPMWVKWSEARRLSAGLSSGPSPALLPTHGTPLPCVVYGPVRNAGSDERYHICLNLPHLASLRFANLIVAHVQCRWLPQLKAHRETTWPINQKNQWVEEIYRSLRQLSKCRLPRASRWTSPPATAIAVAIIAAIATATTLPWRLQAVRMRPPRARLRTAC